MGYCTHESRLVLRSAEIQPFIPRFVRFSCAIDLCRLIVQICTPHHNHNPQTPEHTHNHATTVLRETRVRVRTLRQSARSTRRKQHHTPRRRIPCNSACTHTHIIPNVCPCVRTLHGETTTGAFSLHFRCSIFALKPSNRM